MPYFKLNNLNPEFVEKQRRLSEVEPAFKPDEIQEIPDLDEIDIN